MDYCRFRKVCEMLYPENEEMRRYCEADTCEHFDAFAEGAAFAAEEDRGRSKDRGEPE